MHEVVYKSSPGLPAEEVVRLLRANGLSPRMLDNPDPDPTMEYASLWTLRIRIAVPKNEAARARELLGARDARGAASLAPAVRELRRCVVGGLVWGCIAVGTALLVSGAWRAADVGEVVAAVAGVSIPCMLILSGVAPLVRRYASREINVASEGERARLSPGRLAARVMCLLVFGRWSPRP